MKNVLGGLALILSSGLGMVIMWFAVSRESPAIAMLAFVTVPGVVQSVRMLTNYKADATEKRL